MRLIASKVYNRMVQLYVSHFAGMAPSLSLAGCLFLTCVFSFANAQPLDESAFKQLSSAELHELDITQNPGLLDLAARTGERVVIDIAGPEQGGVVQDGVNVVLNCSSWLSNFPGGTIMWYRYLYTDIDHTMLGTRDEQIKLELNVPNSLRRIEGEFDEIFNITRVRIQLGAEDPHRGIYECEVCTERGNISEQCHSANVTLPIVGRPPILNFTTGRCEYLLQQVNTNLYTPHFSGFEPQLECKYSDILKSGV